jgi:MraZ protein
MFRGNHPTRVDEKGRLKIPADFKRVVDERYGSQFFITSLDGERAQAWPMPEWQKIEDEVVNKPPSVAKKKWLDRTSYYGQVAEMDAQGRVLIPQVLREAAKTIGDVTVLGKLTYLEVTNMPQFVAKLESEPWSDEDAISLGV